MNPAAATEHGAPETAGSNRGERGLGRDSSGRRAPAASRWRPRPRFAPHLLALGGLLALSLGLRLWGIKQGLPYSYNTDEATHFVPKALAFSGGDLNPHYFLNPPAYTYLLFVLFRLWFGGAAAIHHTYAADPTSVYALARVVSAVLGTASVLLLYLAGVRLFGRGAALFAAAILGLAFLAVFYGHLALNDAPTLAPVALSLYGTAGILRGGRTRDYALAGVGVGLAAATKYTGAITLLCVLAAYGVDGSGRGFAGATRRLAVALSATLAAFVAANPYAALDPSAFFSGVSQQASAAGGALPFKLGMDRGSGIVYYLWTFTWGLGWAPALAALAGGALLVRGRRVAEAVVLLAPAVAFVIFMGEQQRFFGRWLLPILPIAALLAGYGAAELTRWVARSRLRLPLLGARRLRAPLVGALVAIPLLAQSLAADVHDDAVLSRPDTRNLARAWMVRHIPAGSKVVIEPIAPPNWTVDVGAPGAPASQRWRPYPTFLTRFDHRGRPLPDGQRRFVPLEQYERFLFPSLVTTYIAHGYCWVVTGSLQSGRTYADPSAAPGAVAYYSALARRGRLVYRVSPYAPGARPVRFSFDWSIDYYPREYRLPGPSVDIYRLTGRRCG